MKFRHELKYLINFQDYSLIRSRLADVLHLDEHAAFDGAYTVTSLYFDDYFNRAYHEKYSGVIDRCKYRIRIYNQSESVINLERKAKTNRYVSKETAALTRQEVDEILQGNYGFLLKSSSNLLRVFYYECLSNLMRPRVVVAYEREAYIMHAGTVRICFDKNVRAGVEGFDLFDSRMPMLEVLNPGLLIMEVKFTEFLPDVIRKILPHRTADHAAVSKYVLCCDKTMYKRYSSF
jgi:hypothetical protein